MEELEPQIDTRTLVLVAFSATAGVLVEFYDFFIYGYAAATVFPSLFFPGVAPKQALVFSYLAFGAGFPARVFGAFIFGHFGDRIGGKSSFLLNLLLVGSATCLTGLLPGYRTLGIAAPILLVLLRLAQGVGVGGEFGGACSLLAEFGAKRHSRAFWMSLANLGIPLGAIASSTVLLIMSRSFTGAGWRIAMLLSITILIPASITRYKLADSPLFETLKQHRGVATMPSLHVLRKHPRPIIFLALFIAFAQMDGYVTGTYFISFMGSAGLPLATVATVLLLSKIVDSFGILVSGPFANMSNRKIAAYVSIIATTLLSYPYARAIVEGQTERIMLFAALISFLGIGLLHGLAPILASENFPTAFRYSGSGIAYSISSVLGGMVAPPVLAGLIGQDVIHKWHYVPAMYLCYCVIAMFALSLIRETRDLRLQDLDDGEQFLAADAAAP